MRRVVEFLTCRVPALFVELKSDLQREWQEKKERKEGETRGMGRGKDKERSEGVTRGIGRAEENGTSDGEARGEENERREGEKRRRKRGGKKIASAIRQQYNHNTMQYR
jgi:hypothetical protein